MLTVFGLRERKKQKMLFSSKMMAINESYQIRYHSDKFDKNFVKLFKTIKKILFLKRPNLCAYFD